MHGGRRYSVKEMYHFSKKYLLRFVAYHSAIVVIFFFTGWKWMAIPWQPLSLIGIAVAFYLGFKNNSAYERMWEARKIWGGIVNASRTFTVMVRDFINNQEADVKLSEDELNGLRKSIVKRHVAWLYALTFQMRQPKGWEHETLLKLDFRERVGLTYKESNFNKLAPYLTDEDLNYILSKGNKASHLVSLQSKHFASLRSSGHLEHFRHLELENMLKEFYTLMGKSERIKNFPFPRQYATVNLFFVVLFIGLLPFGMLNVFSNLSPSYLVFAAIPFSVICSWVFWMMEMIGDFSENPFEGLPNDVPISSISRGIEVDILQMLEEDEIPQHVEFVNPGVVQM
jgi:putative membrane protein